MSDIRANLPFYSTNFGSKKFHGVQPQLGKLKAFSEILDKAENVPLGWRHDAQHNGIQHNDTQHNNK
jgi:hypothetical protein